ncbi:MAG: helix-turn-helix domain-containing protein [Planctomycetes bacterium]|jgi:excisionase family DNA binding protein|nr:helix-turn-helix domain-containing protein [Planctomycetota bacterium]
MAAAKTKKKTAKPRASENGAVGSGEVLTLAEAAAYLRVSEDDVKRLVAEQDLPGRFVGDSWRFLKSALQTWLGTPVGARSGNEAFLALAGSWKDDPDIDEILRNIYKQRGRPMTEEEE